MKARTRAGRRLLPLTPLLAAALALTGCTSLSGLGGDSKYACKAPDGVTCDSVSGTYANALANNLPSQRARQTPANAPVSRAAGETPAEASAHPAATPRATLPTAGGSSPEKPGSALRAQARYLRLWMKPWEDIDGDLYDQAHVYVQIDQGRWLIDHVQQRIRDAHAPLRPPPSTTSSAAPDDGAARPDAAPAIARPLPPLPGRGPVNAPEAPR